MMPIVRNIALRAPLIGAGLLAFAPVHAFAHDADTLTPIEIIAHELSLVQIPMSAAYSESLIDSSAIRCMRLPRM